MTEPTGPPPLRALQLLWWAFTVTMLGLTLVAPLAADATSTVPSSLPAVLAFAAGLAGLAGTIAIDRGLRATPPPDDAEAVTQLRSRLVVQLAIIDAPVLLGVAMTFVLGPAWVAAAAVVPTVVSLLIVRPSPDRLDRIDADWRAGGADVSLRRALLTPSTDRTCL
ncbi:MAG: hypothetical protein WD010_11075 [Nitriliruptor sp.]|uniref:hypothetical protein n=1 Tax=Nitriliruptor sp. TaxID=2448056 RepID=UPI0034A068C5